MIGKKMVQYEILDKLGEGGMGVVYKARDRRLSRDVALKFLPEQSARSDELKERFLQEARSVARLNHPNICQIYTIEEPEGDPPFIVMEYVEGETLQVQFRRTDGHASIPDPDEVLPYAVQIARGLAAAHAQGIIHRDIKSANIMVTAANEVKILDFGLAKMAGAGPLTQTGSTLGTTAYMSPEQVRGEDLDARSDLWSFGVVLYEMLTGSLPFGEDYEHAIMYAIVNQDPSPISGARQDEQRALEAIALRCLAKDPADRYPSASKLLADLLDLRNGLSGEHSTQTRAGLPERSASDPAAPRSPAPSPAGPSVHKRSLLASAGIIAGILLITAIALVFGRGGRGASLPGSDDAYVHVAVLPFTNIGADPQRQIFSEGLVETITSNLTQMRQFQTDLWVIPADEVRSFNVSTAREAERIFGVNYAIAGSLQPIGDRLRLTVTLIDSKNLRQLNSSVIDVQATDVLSLHNQSVERLLAMLDVELQSTARDVLRAGGTTVTAAFDPYVQGRGYLQRYEERESIDRAIGAFQAALALDSDFALAHAGLGHAYWRKFEFTRAPLWIDRAVAQVQRASDLNPTLAQVHITEGLINTGTGDYGQAIRNFTRALASDPANAEAYRGLASAYEAVGDMAAAEDTYLRALRLQPGYWAGYNALGAFYARASRYEEAKAQFREVIDRSPHNYRGYMNLGSMHYFTGDTENARVMWEASMAVEKTHSAASNLATLYFVEERYEDAARLYETALEIDDASYMIWGNLGSAYHAMPDGAERAREVYARAIERALEEHEINPQDPDILASLAGYHAMTGEEARARGYLQDALTIAPENATVLYVAATTFERLGERAAALRYIEAAIERGYSRSEILRQPELQALIEDPRFERLQPGATINGEG
ncbi:MAG: protein kinase [Bacteroidetes bacterium]|jgi:serine/threonine protein kinase/tetratricopeptide (TPR) repeat protein|nr:protein kinase [Bacteroidota bacterium]